MAAPMTRSWKTPLLPSEFQRLERAAPAGTRRAGRAAGLSWDAET